MSGHAAGRDPGRQAGTLGGRQHWTEGLRAALAAWAPPRAAPSLPGSQTCCTTCGMQEGSRQA